MQELIQFDEALFRLINGEWTTAFLDAVMPHWRNKYFWIPLYIFFLAFVGINHGKKFLPFLLAALITVGLSDTISSRLIKKTIKRDRPCNDLMLKEDVKLLIKCGSGYSFTSSHATNHFAIGLFFFYTVGVFFRRSRFLLLLWAFSISYGQVYVGVHYPVDVFVGGCIGASIGIIMSMFYNRYWNFLEPKPIELA